MRLDNLSTAEHKPVSYDEIMFSNHEQLLKFASSYGLSQVQVEAIAKDYDIDLVEN